MIKRPFEEVAEELRPYLVRVALARYQLSLDDVEDLIQDALFQAWKVDDRRQPGCEKAWFGKILHRRFLVWWNARKPMIRIDASVGAMIWCEYDLEKNGVINYTMVRRRAEKRREEPGYKTPEYRQQWLAKRYADPEWREKYLTAKRKRWARRKNSAA